VRVVMRVARVGAHRTELGGGRFICGRDGLEVVRLVEDAMVLGDGGRVCGNREGRQGRTWV